MKQKCFDLSDSQILILLTARPAKKTLKNRLKKLLKKKKRTYKKKTKKIKLKLKSKKNKKSKTIKVRKH